MKNVFWGPAFLGWVASITPIYIVVLISRANKFCHNSSNKFCMRYRCCKDLDLEPCTPCVGIDGVEISGPTGTSPKGRGAFDPWEHSPVLMCYCAKSASSGAKFGILVRFLIPNTHRRRQRDSTVELSCVGGVYTPVDCRDPVYNSAAYM